MLDLMVNGDRVTSRLTFNFKDGSIQNESTEFSQHGHFRLISNRLVQKGPSFARPLEMTIDAEAGRVTVTYADDGKKEIASERLQLRADLANGIVRLYSSRTSIPQVRSREPWRIEMTDPIRTAK